MSVLLDILPYYLTVGGISAFVGWLFLCWRAAEDAYSIERYLNDQWALAVVAVIILFLWPFVLIATIIWAIRNPL